MEKHEQIVIIENQLTWQPGRGAIANGLNNNVGMHIICKKKIFLTLKFRTNSLGVDFGKNRIFNIVQ